MILNAIRDVQHGKEPPLVLRTPNENVFNDLVVLAQLIDENVDPKAHCASIVSTQDYHALQA
jgi:hypothetical protein